MAVSSRLIKKSPTIIKKLYYNIIPFSKRYGNEFNNTYDFLIKSLDWDKEKLKEYQFNKLRDTIKNEFQSFNI